VSTVRACVCVCVCERERERVCVCVFDTVGLNRAEECSKVEKELGEAKRVVARKQNDKKGVEREIASILRDIDQVRGFSG
jgi:septal ring factor EnvC (AmiA/AmiB activator)